MGSWNCHLRSGTSSAHGFDRTARGTILTCALWLLTTAPAAAQPAAPDPAPQSTATSSSIFSAGGEAVLASSYVWRGFLESDKLCLQPDAWVSVGPILFDVWMNLEIADGRLHTAEYDLSLYYTRDIPRATLLAGVTNYFFDSEEGGYEGHSELAVSLATDFPLNPTFEAYYSVSDESGAFASLALSHPYRLSPRFVITPETAIGYNHRMWVEGSGFSDVRGTLKLSYEHPSGHVQLKASVDFVHGFMPEVVGNRVVGAVGVTVQ